MKKTNNKKGFTIVELVIVIAVIAILAAVLIPTFSGVIDKANESKVLQVAQAAYKEAYALAVADGKIDTTDVHTVGDYQFTFSCKDGSTSINDLETITVKELKDSPTNEDGYSISVSVGGVVSVSNTETTNTWEKESDTEGQITPPQENN